MNVKPGDMVMFRLGSAELARGDDDPMPRMHPAMVTRVGDAGRLNLTIFWDAGITGPVAWREAVPYLTDARGGESAWYYRS